MSDFTVRPFAFMRLTHEALRHGFLSLESASKAGDLATATALYSELRAAMLLHKRHEEEVFFPLLDARFDGAVLRAGLRDTHIREAAFESAVETALENGDPAALEAAVAEWAQSFEAHLAEEEAVMMPLTEQVAETVEERARAVGEILAADWDGLPAQLHYVVRSLSATKPFGPVRMFVAAVQVAAGDRYATLEPAIRSALSADAAGMLERQGHLRPVSA